MTKKLALIVDDSRLARIKLGKRLEEFGLDIDSADSAEDALSYLQFRKPDIIFMDHTMPGMDGLQALKIIKEDPQTAMIPVVMYTSQEGEVYVGQARALGAMGVLPKQIQSTDLANILERLHLTDRQNEEPEEVPPRKEEAGSRKASVAGAATPRITPHPALRKAGDGVSVDLPRFMDELRAEMRRQITLARQPLAEDLDAIRQHLVRTHRRHDEILDSLQRQLHEQQNLLQRLEEATVSGMREQAVRGWRMSALSLLLLMLAGGAYLMGEYWDARGMRMRLEQKVAMQTEEIERLRQQIDASEQILENLAPPGTPASSTDTLAMAEALAWGFNQAGGFDYGTKALDEDRARLFGELLDRLEAAGYLGKVRLDLHFGRFCLNGAGRPASDDMPIGKCRIPPPGLEDAQLPANQESMSFARLLDSHPALRSGQIEVEIVSHGTREPLVPYPAEAATAGEWNRIARRNNRVVAHLQPG